MGLRHEGEQVEFKLAVNEGALKTIVAFANTNGGTLYIGVDDEGAPVGLANPDAELTKLTSMMHDSISPDILMMTSCGIEDEGAASIIVVRVGRGVRRPYYLSSKGLRPEGVYIRNGAVSVPSSDTAILRMIRESEGDSFEERVSFNQSLTFGHAAAAFAKKGLALGANEMRTLGMVDADGAYTNLGLILSDQCPAFVKCAQFSDDDKTTFTARKECDGSILKQLVDAYGFLERSNRFQTSFKGLERSDYHDYPPVALREALVNSVAHREYALSGPTLVSVMPSRVEIVSLGGLPFGLEYSDLEAHISVPRNRLLANVLYRLEMIEAYGTGIGRMHGSYRGSGMDISIEVTPNTFTVVLPNRNAASTGGAAGTTVDKASDAVIELLSTGAKTRREVQEALGLSQSTALRALDELIAGGFVVRAGGGRSTVYQLAREHRES